MAVSLNKLNPSRNKQSLFTAWLVVGLLFFVGALNYLDRIMITTMRESITQSIPMTDAQFGLLTSVFLWVYGLLSPFVGYLADRFSRSRMIILSIFVWSGVTWLTAYATTYEELLITRALMGISEACYIPAALALITDYHKGSTRSTAVGIHMTGMMLGSSLGFLGGWIAEKNQWHDAFIIFGIIGIVFSFVLFFLLRDSNSDIGSLKEKNDMEGLSFVSGMKDLFSKKSFILLLIFWSFIGLVGWMIIGWLPTYYKEHFNLSQTNSGLYATGYFYPLGIAGVLVGGYLADRWSNKSDTSRIMVPILGLCIAAPGVFVASSTSIYYIAIAGFMIYGFTRYFSDTNLMPILCMVADKRYIATGYGTLNLFSCIVGGVGIYLSGLLRDADIDMALQFKIAAFTMLICAGLLYLVKRDVEKSSKE